VTLEDVPSRRWRVAAQPAGLAMIRGSLGGASDRMCAPTVFSVPNDPSASAHEARAFAPRRELALLLTLAAMQFIHIVDFMVVMPLGPQFMRLFALGPAEFGVLVSTYTFAAAASGFVAAFHIDRHDRRTALLVLYAAFLVSTALCGLAPSYPLLLAARALAGAFGGVIGALVLAIVADIVPYARRARGTAIVGAAFSVAAVMGVPIGLWLASRWSWRAPFLTLAVVGIPVGLVAARLIPALTTHLSHATHRHPFAQLAAIFGERNHRRAFAMSVALTFGGFSVIPFISPYYVANVGVREADLPLVYLVSGTATLFTAQLIGHWADRYGKKRVFTWIAAASIVPLLVTTHLPPVPLSVALAASTLFFVLVAGRFGPAQALTTGAAERRLRGSFMSFNAAILQLGSGSAALVAGLIIGRGSDGALLRYGWVGVMAAGCTVLAIALAARIRVVPDGSGGPA
jgi:predicted MFS family arabinose efflux permease